jgi:serine/threonine protein kinase/tetratricopeptide (TPR) repeat protein
MITLEESQRDELLMELVDAALEQPSEGRASYLRSACGDDAVLRAEVEERVQWEQRMGGFLRDAVINAVEFLDGSFECGEYVAGRYRILREVGRGGMGVVYEAFDERLERHIAIKAARPGYGHRLPPEARAACQVAHFNVCKVHDLHSTQTEFGDVDFLTMEFIDGETLSARVRRAGPLTEREARDIALQICAGLAQAHRQGVVHGDLKCGNVILAKSPEGGTRAVLTDFGLAKLKLSDGESGKTSQPGGSFDYMAPELFAGVRVSVASDVYALGVIFHEMLTGKAPVRVDVLPEISNKTSTLTLLDPVFGVRGAPRCDDLPSPWGAIVTRCLESSAEDRFASAGEVADLLKERRGTRTWAALASAAIAILLLVPPPVPPPPVRLAVLPFAVEGSHIQAAAGLSIDVADRLSGLRRGFIVIPPGEAQRNQVDTPEKAKATLAATHILRTRLKNSGAQITVLASVIDTTSGHALQELKGAYSPGDVAVLAKALTATVTSAFHLQAGVPKELVAAPAYPHYVQGINLLRRDPVSADEAIPLFQKAIELDARSALPYAGLAEAQLQKFERNYGRSWLDLAGESVAKAQSLNADSAPVLLAAGLFKQKHGWYELAALDFGRALELAPNNAEGWKRLAGNYGLMSRPDEAAATYQKAIAAQPDYYAPYLDFGRHCWFAGQFKEAEQLARRAIALAPGLAAGHMLLGLALWNQDRLPEAEESLKTALRLHESIPYLTNVGALYYQKERYQEAAQFFEKGMKVEPRAAILCTDLADAYRHLGRSEEAAEMYRRSQQLAESEVALNPRAALSRAELAFASAQLGDRSRAEFEIIQALQMSSDNIQVKREAAYTYEALGEREKTLEVLSRAPAFLAEDLSRQPDMKDLKRDPRFQELLKNK